MDAQARDNTVTIAAIGLLAYASADIAHHALGHGAACLGLGGRIISPSSIFVNCSLHGSTIDLAGPCANLVLGLVALLGAHCASSASSTTRLFYILVAAFNLLWFSLQLAFSAATRTDDWAWPIHEFHLTGPVRYGMIAVGALAYLLTIRAIAAQMAPLANPLTRARAIVFTAWLTAGALACATAAFDHHAVAAIWRHAAPQSFVLSLGLLFVPARAAASPSASGRAATIVFSVPWVVAAAIVAAASILFLGPGVAIAL
jgi:hypothetical protein